MILFASSQRVCYACNGFSMVGFVEHPRQPNVASSARRGLAVQVPGGTARSSAHTHIENATPHTMVDTLRW